MQNYEQVVKMQKENSKELISDTLETIEQMFCLGKKISIRKVAEEAKVSTAFICSHEELKEKIKYYKSIKPSEITFKRINALMVENKRLEEQILFYTTLIENELKSK